MSMTIEGRTAVVTGASSGIGAAVATRLVKEGARVALLARRGDLLAELEEELVAAGGEVMTQVVDVSADAQVQVALANVRARFGQVDLVVLSAGSYAYAPVAEARLTDWEATVGSSLWGTALMIRHLIDDLSAAGSQGPADIICVSSVAAHSAFPGFAIYGAAKAGVEQFAAALRAELGPAGVRVCTLELGVVETEAAKAHSTPAEPAVAALSPDDIGDLVTYVVGRPPGVSYSHIRVLPTSQI